MTKQFIFVSRSDKTVEESIQGNRVVMTAADIFVYNWKGEVLAQLTSDYAVGAFAVDAGARYLYGYVSTPYPKLVKYTLPTDIF